MFGTVANGIFAGSQIYLQPAKIKIQHFGVSLKFWSVIESIAYKD